MSESQELNELKSDLTELEGVLGTVNRSNVRRIIADAISSLRAKFDEVTERNAKPDIEQEKDEIPAKQTLYTKKITTYGWDESDKFTKLYVTIPNIEKLTEEQITCDFTNISFKFIANNHDGKNHMLQVVKLANNIVPSLSTCRIKNGNIIIALKKEREGCTWENLTDAEKKQKEVKDAKYDSSKDTDAGDPSAGVMNLMKKMYDDGDDDMKRMIKKSWYESQQKQKTGELPGM